MTEERLPEEVLDPTNDLHQKIIDALPIPIFYRDVNGVYRSCNRAHERFLGLPKEEIIGKTVYDTQPPDIAEIYARRDQELFESQGIQTYDSQFRYADGSIHDVVFNKAVIRNEEGEITGIVGSIIDVTERRKAEVELVKAEESKEIASAMLHKMRAAVVMVDEGLKVIDANPSFAKMFGEDLVELYEAIPGLHSADLRKLIPQKFIKMFTTTLSTGEPMQERDVRHQNRLLHMVVVTIYKHKVVGAIIRDMSAPMLQHTEIINRAQEVNRKHLDTVQKIAYLLGENAAETEDLLKSIIETYHYGDEENG
ncbi:PAS domain S-box protein [Prolixibacteraceae bacterium JC049]|nr:PAS domain S-box protein [Prolixibacteraceae bacterium JC049]